MSGRGISPQQADARSKRGIAFDSSPNLFHERGFSVAHVQAKIGERRRGRGDGVEHHQRILVVVEVTEGKEAGISR